MPCSRMALPGLPRTSMSSPPLILHQSAGSPCAQSFPSPVCTHWETASPVSRSNVPCQRLDGRGCRQSRPHLLQVCAKKTVTTAGMSTEFFRMFLGWTASPPGCPGSSTPATTWRVLFGDGGETVGKLDDYVGNEVANWRHVHFPRVNINRCCAHFARVVGEIADSRRMRAPAWCPSVGFCLYVRECIAGVLVIGPAVGDCCDFSRLCVGGWVVDKEDAVDASVVCGFQP
jgi:hypothetical protein